MEDPKGKFTKGNKAATKPVYCPYCNKELSVRIYTYLDKKIEISRFKTDWNIKMEEEETGGGIQNE